MRVAFIAPYPVDLERPAGGVESVVKDLVHQLASMGVECHVLAVNPGASETDTGQSGVVVHRLPEPATRAAAAWMETPARLRKLLALVKPDITHVHGIAVWAAAAPSPAVLTIHGVPEREIKLRGRSIGRALAPLIGAAERACLRGVRDIILINPYVRELRRFGADHRLWNIPNPIDRRYFVASTAARSVNQAVTNALWIGNDSARKNLRLAIEMLVHARRSGMPLTLTVAGVGASDRSKNVQEAVAVLRDADLGQHVHFVGRQSQEQLVQLLDRADLLLLTSLQETAPCVVSEALARGLYVVGPRAFGIPHMLPDSQAGSMFSQWAPEAIVATVAASREAAQTGHQYRRLLARQYHPEVVATATLGAYNVIGSK